MVNYDELAVSYDKDLERAVLCDILITKRLNAALKVDFFTGKEKNLFEAIFEQWTKFRELDIEVLKPSHYEAIEAALNSAGASSSKAAIESLRQEYIKRSRGLVVLQNAAIDNHEEALKAITRDINNVLHSKSLTDYNHIEEIGTMTNSLEAEVKRGRGISGFSTGITALDDAINGITPANFYVIGALKKTGKSRFMVHLALKLAAQGVTSLIDSLEMSSVQLNLCALSAYTGIDARKFGRMLTPQQMENFNCGLSALHSLTWQIHRDYTISDLWARADYLKSTKNIQVVFVDFLQRLRDERYRGDRVREVENIAQELANMSRELNLAIIALSQLRGEAERLGKDEIPSMSYLKESHGIGENMDCLLMLHNPNRLENPISFDGSYIIQSFKILVEQRYGITGQTIECDADLRTCSFCDKVNS